MIVYIPASSFKGSAEDAIKYNLMCKINLRDELMACLTEDGEGVLIIHDAIDELRTKAALDSLQDYVKNCKDLAIPTKVFVSSRSGLCPLDPKRFHRKLNIEGFSTEQGITFIEKYFQERYSFTDHPVLTYVKGHKDKLQFILCNPLRTFIFSELIARGSLTLKDVKTLKTVKLLKCLEGHIVRRDTEKYEPEQSSNEAVTFYQLCLQMLLAEERKFDGTQIDRFSSYQAFLRKETALDDEGMDLHYYTCCHEMIFEYFAVRGLIDCIENHPEQKDILLLHLCSDRNMRDILQLTIGFIFQYKPDLYNDLVSIVRACLILQCESHSCERNPVTERLLQLPNKIGKLDLSNFVVQSPAVKDITKMTQIWSEINDAFENNLEMLRNGKWFQNTFSNVV